MARSGNYVNVKEVVARYVGDRLVWRKAQPWNLVNEFNSRTWIEYTGFEGRGISLEYAVPRFQANGINIISHNDTTKVVIDGRTYTNVSVEVNKIYHRTYFTINVTILLQNYQELQEVLRGSKNIVQIYKKG